MGTNQSQERTTRQPRINQPHSLPISRRNQQVDNASSSNTNSPVVPKSSVMPIVQRHRQNDPNFYESPRKGSLSGSYTLRKPIAVDFNWNLGGDSVMLTGSFTNWKTEIPMTRDADGVWHTIQHLEIGVHQYKFIVDGVWRHHPDQPTVHDEVGNINNFIDVNEQKSREVFPQRPPSPPGSYAQTLPPELDGGPPLQGKAAVPPSMPPHLLRALLNTAPSPDDHTTLPLPHHVMVGHLYAFPRKDDDSAAVLGATHMYKSKYVTTVYYHKPTKHIV